MDYSKLIVSLILRLPYRAPLAMVPHLLPQHNGVDPSFREGPARKNLLIGRPSSFSYPCPKGTVSK